MPKVFTPWPAKTTQAVKTTPHINEGKEATLVPGTVRIFYRKGKERGRRGLGGSQASPVTGS